MSELTVGVGDQVQSKQQVGTGTSMGEHLHFEIHLNEMFGQTVDPIEYLPAM